MFKNLLSWSFTPPLNSLQYLKSLINKGFDDMPTAVKLSKNVLHATNIDNLKVELVSYTSFNILFFTKTINIFQRLLPINIKYIGIIWFDIFFFLQPTYSALFS